ncbi:hypothetical protein V8E51_015523 [Hyaloscypha variabilis]
MTMISNQIKGFWPRASADNQSSLWVYDPSVAAAAVFAVLYTIACAVTVFQYFWFKCWFWIFMVIASLSELIPSTLE